jgi:MarR family transcriptional regulator for hemolysin
MAPIVNRKDRLNKAEQIEVAVPEAARAFRKIYETAFNRLGLDLKQARLIGQLDVATNQTLNQTELARLVGLPKAAIGTAIDALVVRGFISRLTDPRDGRAKLVSLTAEGRRLAASVDQVFGELAAVSRRNITREQRRVLVTILATMRANLEEYEKSLVEWGDQAVVNS